jgi:hypothetical protein
MGVGQFGSPDALNFDYLSLWLIAIVVVLVYSTAVVIRNWKTYSFPIKLVPLDALTLILLIDLNIKSNSNLTIADTIMKVEALAFTVLLAFVLFAPVFWKILIDRKKKKAR